MRTQNKSYKTILLGDSSVGKTSLFIRLTQGVFFEQVSTTLQMDIGRKGIKVKNIQNLSEEHKADGPN